MQKNIQRATELFLCERLQSVIPELKFYPFIGFGNDDTNLEPPFVVIAITEAEKMLAQEGTWQCKGTMQIISHIDETDSDTHAAMTERVYLALTTVCHSVTHPEFRMSGLDIQSMRNSQDKDLKAHSDIIEFVTGVSRLRIDMSRIDITCDSTNITCDNAA